MKALEKGLRNAMIYIGLSVALLATLGYYFAAGIAVLLLLRMLFGTRVWYEQHCFSNDGLGHCARQTNG
ncbi:hypothetical protein Q0F98_30680 [Paenibacillus amylolyticus]|nr:hypothetical protein Q0F98_30680 [Paenibacillus amylolyticus]